MIDRSVASILGLPSYDAWSVVTNMFSPADVARLRSLIERLIDARIKQALREDHERRCRECLIGAIACRAQWDRWLVAGPPVDLLRESKQG